MASAGHVINLIYRQYKWNKEVINLGILRWILDVIDEGMGTEHLKEFDEYCQSMTPTDKD